MATYVVYPNSTTAGAINEVLVREDVTDLVSNLFPLDTQLQAWCDKVSMSQVLLESPVDTYASSSGVGISRAATAYSTGALVKEEGFVPSDGGTGFPIRLRAVAELHVESFGVSGTDRVVGQYAIRDRYTYEALKMTRKVVNDFEMDFWWGQGTAPNGQTVSAINTLAGPIGGSNFKRATQGVVPWIARTGLSRTKTGLGAVYNAHGELINQENLSYAYDAANINLDRGMFEFSLMSPWWDIGGEPDGCVMFVSPKVKALFSTIFFTAQGPVNERKIDAADKLIIDTVTAYETQFGMHYLNKSRYLNIGSTVSVPYATTYTTGVASAQATYTLPMDEVLVALMPAYWKIGVFRGVGFAPLAKTGDLDRGMLTGEQAMVCTNPIAGAGIFNCVS